MYVVDTSAARLSELFAPASWRLGNVALPPRAPQLLGAVG